MFGFQFPLLFAALHAQLHSAPSAIGMDFINGLLQSSLLFAVYGVEKVALDFIVGTGIGEDYPCLFVKEASVATPRRFKDLHGGADDFLLGASGHGQEYRALQVILRLFEMEAVCEGEYRYLFGCSVLAV